MGEDHNKILNKAAAEILKPFGMFQKGRSRIWIDDNGWFLIIVEFQPSGWDKGSYLNVAVNYLWERKDYISFDYGHRENAFVPFGGDEEKFYSNMLALAEKAKAKAEEYRLFRDIPYAKEKILNYKGHSSLSHQLYNKMMMCGLAKDPRTKRFFEELADSLKYSELGWEKAYFAELEENIAPIISDADKFREYIIGKVKAQREYWRGTYSMKKLKAEWDFQR